MRSLHKVLSRPSDYDLFAGFSPAHPLLEKFSPSLFYCLPLMRVPKVFSHPPKSTPTAVSFPFPIDVRDCIIFFGFPGLRRSSLFLSTSVSFLFRNASRQHVPLGNGPNPAPPNAVRVIPFPFPLFPLLLAPGFFFFQQCSQNRAPDAESTPPITTSGELPSLS